MIMSVTTLHLHLLPNTACDVLEVHLEVFV